LKPFELLHGQPVPDRRVRPLQRHFESLRPRSARVLDVGCGDGDLAARLAGSRSDVRLEGIDGRCVTAWGELELVGRRPPPPS
jgi:methylase of polypeptide subunit release factors